MSHFRQDSEEAEDIFASTFSSSTAVGKVKISGGDSGTEQLFYVPVAAVSGGGIGIKGAPTGAVSEKQQILEKGELGQEKTDPSKDYPTSCDTPPYTPTTQGGSPAHLSFQQQKPATPKIIRSNLNQEQQINEWNSASFQQQQQLPQQVGAQGDPKPSMIHASTETLPNPIRCQGGKEDYYSSPEDEETAGGDTFLEVTVAEPLKVGEGISSFLMFRVTTKTNLPFFKSDNFGVNRRFSDFLGVHEKLSEKYLPRGRVIPPAPEKSIIGATKVKMTSAATSGGGGNPSSSSSAPASAAMSYSNNFAASSSASHQDEGSQPSAADQNQAEFIARRRFALERFINRVGQHPVLRRDPIFVEFLESNRDLPRATSTSAISSASVFRLLGKVGDTVNKITYKMEENDPWYEEKILQIDSLENQFKKLYGLIENLVQCRHDLALATGSFAHGTAMLSNTEEAHSLSRALAYLAKVEEKVQEVHHNQAEADYFYLFELVKDYVALIGAVKEVLAERSKAFQTWQHAQSMVIKKKEQRARLEMGGKSDKIPAANEEVMEWETRLEESQENFNQISETIKGEIDFFERYRVKDFKFAILQYLEALMNCQLQMVKHWEEFLPEVKSILF